QANLVGPSPFQIEVVSDSLAVRSRVRVLPIVAGVEVQSTSFWQSNQVELNAHFDRSNNLPELASLKAPKLVVSGQNVGLPPYLDLGGSVSGKWERGHFDVDLEVKAHPLPSETNFPPVTLALHARGDTNSLIIQTANISGPWVRANLSRELALHLQGPLL